MRMRMRMCMRMRIRMARVRTGACQAISKPANMCLLRRVAFDTFYGADGILHAI